MGDKIPLADEKVVIVDGYFNISETYNDVKNYLEVEHGYDMGEASFTEKNDGTSRYVYSVLKGDFPFSDYLKIDAVIKLELKGEEVEVEDDGKKIILVKGSGKIAVGFYGDADWLGKRSNSPFMTFVMKMTDKFYHKDLIKKLKKTGTSQQEGVLNVFKKDMRATIK